MFKFFQFSIPSLLTAIEQIIEQLHKRAEEKRMAADEKFSHARDLMDLADQDRVEARVATNMADKLGKLLK